MKSIKVHYFALFREMASCDSESIEFEGTYQDLYLHLSKKHGFDLPSEMIQVAVDDEFTTLSNQIHENAKVVFIPPVAGG
jgi:molybdopterin synthase sulfur carrier subunit